MTNNSKETTDKIDLAGGSIKVAESLDVSNQAMWKWGDIPKHRAVAMRKLAKARVKELIKLFNKYYGELK